MFQTYKTDRLSQGILASPWGRRKKNEVMCELFVSHSFRLSPKNDYGELL